MIDFSILLEAYFDCRRHKRKTVGATEFEMNYMSNLVQLLDEIKKSIHVNIRSANLSALLLDTLATAKCSLVSFVIALSITISH